MSALNLNFAVVAVELFFGPSVIFTVGTFGAGVAIGVTGGAWGAVGVVVPSPPPPPLSGGGGGGSAVTATVALSPEVSPVSVWVAVTSPPTKHAGEADFPFSAAVSRRFADESFDFVQEFALGGEDSHRRAGLRRTGDLGLLGRRRSPASESSPWCGGTRSHPCPGYAPLRYPCFRP